jgi:cell fate (sporulation/competence/biofilm development) regulator YmcA (YheA/YmcA/DUF963 family)
MIGDSHMRGCADELGNQLGKDFAVTSTIMRGAGLTHITKLAKKEIDKLTKKDAVVIWAGSNDINKNEAMKGLKHMQDFVHQRTNTNVLIVPAPHRHDLTTTSCVNEVQIFNRKLRKIMKNKDKVRVLNPVTVRADFTKHGLHLNANGKEKVMKLISHKISSLINDKKTRLIILEWRNTVSKPNLDNQPNEFPKEDYTSTDGSAIGNSVRTGLNNLTARTSSRTKKTPTSRNEEFLWT